jgi:hypothetical protein
MFDIMEAIFGLHHQRDIPAPEYICSRAFHISVALIIVSTVLAMAGTIELNIHAATKEFVASQSFHSALNLSFGSSTLQLTKPSNLFAFNNPMPS